MFKFMSTSRATHNPPHPTTPYPGCRVPTLPVLSLGVRSDPVDDAVLVKVGLMGEHGGRAVPDPLDEREGGPVVVVPLLRHLQVGGGGGGGGHRAVLVTEGRQSWIVPPLEGGGGGGDGRSANISSFGLLLQQLTEKQPMMDERTHDSEMYVLC